MINLAGRWPRRQWRGGGASAGAAGAVLVFGLAVGLPLLAAKTPTRIVELEDPNVKTGNAGLYPALWTPHRIRYRAGRLLQPDSWLKVRVRPAQDVSRLTVELNFLAARPELYELVAWRDKQELGRFRGRQSKDWDVAVFELDGWPPGGELWLTLEGPTTERRRVLIVDRAVFSKR